jgi:hypothetical protein
MHRSHVRTLWRAPTTRIPLDRQLESSPNLLPGTHGCWVLLHQSQFQSRSTQMTVLTRLGSMPWINFSPPNCISLLLLLLKKALLKTDFNLPLACHGGQECEWPPHHTHHQSQQTAQTALPFKIIRQRGNVQPVPITWTAFTACQF